MGEEEARWRPRQGPRPPSLRTAARKHTSKCREERGEVRAGRREEEGERWVGGEEDVNVGQDRGEGGWGLPRCIHNPNAGEPRPVVMGGAARTSACWLQEKKTAKKKKQNEARKRTWWGGTSIVFSSV